MLPLSAVLQVLLSAALIGLILMHSGRDAGLGGMGFTPASQGGTHIVERNLTRLTLWSRSCSSSTRSCSSGCSSSAGAEPLDFRRMQFAGLHHITCVCSDAQRTLDFYRDRLGFALVKKTVNFDDPHSYHLYFGDDVGRPGTLITFFEWPRAEPGRLGRGTLESIGLESPSVTDETELEDPDGLRLRLYPAKAPRLRDVVVIGNPDLYAGLFSPDAPLQFAEPVEEAALIGAGTTHHIAWRVSDGAQQVDGSSG